MAILTNTKILWGIIILLILMNLVTLGSIWLSRDPQPVFDQQRIVQNQPRGGGQFLKRYLGFSAQQEIKFDSLMIEHRKKLEDKAEEIRSLREELMGKIRNQEFTEEAETLVRQIGETQSELEMLNYKHFSDVMSICTEDQKELFIQTIQRAVGPHYRRGYWRRGLEEDARGWRRRGR